MKDCSNSIGNALELLQSFDKPMNIITVHYAANPGPILGLHPANERRRYFVTTSLIGWAQTWHQPWNPSHLLGHWRENS